jgi:hypothetical protein
VRLDWIKTQPGGFHPNEVQRVLGVHKLGFALYRVTERDVDTEWLPKYLAGELALRAEAHALVRSHDEHTFQPTSMNVMHQQLRGVAVRHGLASRDQAFLRCSDLVEMVPIGPLTVI